MSANRPAEKCYRTDGGAPSVTVTGVAGDLAVVVDARAFAVAGDPGGGPHPPPR
jgi:hypothetical protein